MLSLTVPYIPTSVGTLALMKEELNAPNMLAIPVVKINKPLLNSVYTCGTLIVYILLWLSNHRLWLER